MCINVVVINVLCLLLSLLLFYILLCQVGDLVFAKLVVANKDMEPELVCIDSNQKANGLGVLKGGGYVIRTSISLARR